MNLMKKLILFLLFISLVHCTSEPERQAETRQSNGFFEFISSVKMPEHLEWCGEKVPLDIPEVRERAEREFYLLLQRPGQLILYIKRSGRYFPLFERIIKENGMPEDLKYLSVAESALYMSRSSKGAVGLWQFIPSTARHYGLAVNDLVDERRNVEKSTKAAMKYLKQGYKSHKSWMMAAAGYNMGHSNLKFSADLQESYNYFDLFLNDETSRYIFRIVIIKELMENAAKYGLNIPDEEQYKPYKTKKVLVEGKVSNIAAWAKKHGTTYKYVKLYNPWILKRSLPKPPNRGVWVVEIPE
jgi:hypothetical protein